jgi:putative membrane protein
MMGYGARFGHPGFFLVVGILLVIGLVVLIVWAVSRSRHGVSSSSPDRVPDRADALEILRLRFARGEITEAEFVQAKKALGYER